MNIQADGSYAPDEHDRETPALKALGETRPATSIRSATMDDVPRIVEMAERFYATSGYPDFYGPMAKESAAGLAIITMQGAPEFGVEPGVMLVAEHEGELVGMACVHIDRFLFNSSVKVGHELAFWIEPEHRGGRLAARLLCEIETAVAARGATVNRMATLATSPPQAAAIYERMGYTRSESFYSKGMG